MTSHETTTESQRTVTPNGCDDNGLGAALDSAMGTPAELAEIDENLLRAELFPAQRAASIARRREIWEALHGEETRRNPAGLGGRGNVGFAGDVERATGEDQRRTREHLRRTEALGPDLHAVVGTSLDKGVELDALKELSPEERRPFARARHAEAEVELLRAELADASARVDDASSIGCRQWPASAALARCMRAFALRSHMRITQGTRQGGQ